MTLFGDAVLGNARAATPTLPDTVALRPFEPDLRAVGAIERALQAAAGPDGWERVAQALGAVLLGPPPTANERAIARAGDALAAALRPDPSVPAPMPSWASAAAALGQLIEDIELPDLAIGNPRVKFCAGLVAGAAEAVTEELQAQIRSLATFLGGIVHFYALVYDVKILVALFDVWFVDPVGSPPTELEEILSADYPQLWTAMEGASRLVAQLERIAGQLRDGSGEQSGLSTALAAVGDWIYRLPQTLGGALRPHLDAVVAARGDPREQGTVIGRLVAPAVLQIILAALDLANLARNAATFFADEGPLLLAQTRDLAGEAIGSAQRAAHEAFAAEELASAGTRAEQLAPDIKAAAADVVSGTLRQLTEEWGELGYLISPYRMNRVEAGAWNKAARDFASLTKKDAEYAIKLRLDSNHIFEDRWFDEFADEFKKAFKDWPVLDSRGRPVLVDGQPLVVSWTSSKDMDAIAIHTEAHIRSGDRMADLGLLGAEGRPPLNPEMDAFFEGYRERYHGGRPFANLREVVEAHKRFYQEERTRTLWPRLSGWFARVDAALLKASL